MKIVLSRDFLGWLAMFVLLGNAVMLRAEPFGDIEVSSQQGLFSGNIHGGYTEHRLLVVNRSASRSHRVTLTLPRQSHGNRDAHISRLSRTITVARDASAVVSLWQPPLQISGDGSVLVAVDGRVRGALKNGFQSHLNHYGSGVSVPTLLLGRNVNRDNLDRLLKATVAPTGISSISKHSPDKATGAPDAPLGITYSVPNTWAADDNPGGKEWLELDFTPAFAADGLEIFTPTFYTGSITEISLRNEKGVEIKNVPPPSHATTTLAAPIKGSGKTPPRPSLGRTSAKTSFPITTETVKTVRITFDMSHGLNWVDAVELSGGTNRAWASVARASSSSSGVGGGPRLTHGPRAALLPAELDPAQWSEHWLSYTAFDAVLLPQGDFAQMPEAARTALWRYTESGGRFVVLGRIEVPESWRSREISSSNGITHHRVGLGECLQLDASAVENLTAPQAAKLKMLLAQPATLSVMERGPHFNNLFPVVDETDLPVRGMAFLMLVFILVVGPINLLVLRAFKRRIWFLWTIPVVSAVTCLLVLIYSLTSEGITPSTRTEAVTLLDQSTRRATTAALMAFYCPLTPSDGLHFSTETEVTPLLVNQLGAQQTGHEVDWSNGQHFLSGWLSARVPAHFFARKSESRRERLQIERTADGKLTVVNGLGAQVKTLWLVDAQGQLHKTDVIEAGDRATLTATGETTGRGPLPDLSRFVNDPLNQIPTRSLANLKPWLRPGVYFAELEGAPFVETAMTGRTKSRASSLVIGLLEPEALR
ncbi:MAG: hypothetical protein EXS29_04190 [Pedosphaera sp.]|nr:hypothetical protein [Pedosphaera sp.]